MRKDVVEKKLTPFLWELSQKGTVFENCFSVASWTLPSFKGILTSTYPLMFEGKLRIDENRTSLAQVLQKAGYKTIGLTYHPNLHRYFGYNAGFDYFFDDIEGEWEWGGSLIREIADSMFKYLKNKELLKKLTYYYSLHIMKRSLKTGYKFHFPAEEINKKAVELLKKTKKPYFCWLHYLDAHFPYLPKKTRLSEKEVRRLNLLRERWYRGGKKVNGEDLRKLKGLYKQKVKEIDSALKMFFEKAKKEGLLKNTIVVITSDHGEEFNEHGAFHHEMNLYDELTHVPLIILGSHLKKKKVSKPVSQIDLAPTILDLLKMKKPKQWLGESMFKNNRRYVISEEGQKLRGEAIRNNFTLNLNYKKIAIRNKDKKYIYNERGKDELFDLKKDPREKRNKIKEGVPVYFKKALTEHLGLLKNRPT